MAERHAFQAEIQQLLDMVIHSLYTDREIFIRELISNAADACERLRFLQASGQPVYQPELPLVIKVKTDAKENTITITDTGVGMSEAELVENLGTIAHSGTKAFIKQLAAEKRADAKLIGQFGVGFYSAFMVASQVTVITRSANPSELGWKWISEGAGGYEIEPAGDVPRGTQVILKLKDDAREFAQAVTLRRLIQRYSNFLQYPIELDGERLNTVQAIWTRNKNEIKDEEYQEFYRYIGHDTEPPLLRLHFTADAPLAIHALLFVPRQNWESFGFIRTECAVSLYCKKVLITARPKGLLPEWLRFLKGVVDSEDLPLNISRETMQDTALVQKLNQALTGRFLKFLEKTAADDPATYEKFYVEYHRFLKEGIINDPMHREALGKLLRFESSATEAGKTTSLGEYAKRMQADQKHIYYLLASSREAAEASPYYEAFKARKIEVLFLYDAWDEFVMEHLHEAEGRTLCAAEKADIDAGEDARKQGALSETDAKELAQWLKETLGSKVNEVRISKRLIESPAVLVDSDQILTTGMRRLLKAVGRDDLPSDKPHLEINPAHPVICRLAKARNEDRELAALVAAQIFDNACVAAGLLEDSREMLKRLNQLMEKVMTPKA